jgi:hypothetical protein
MKLKSCHIIIFTLFFLSCNKLVNNKNTANNATAVFNYLWNEIDSKYSFIEYKQLDWNAIKNKYQSQIYDGMEQEALFKVCSNMMNELRDGHANLISPFDVSYYYPIFLTVQKTLMRVWCLPII